MLTFSSLNLPYRHENKGLDFAAQINEDPFTDVFDQYISQDSSSSSDNVNEAYDSRGFHPRREEGTASNNNYVTAQPLSSFAHSHGRRLHSSSYNPISAAHSSEALLSRRNHKSLYFDKPTPAISGLELLSLEGKLSYQAPAKLSSSLSNAPALPLRRKAKFTPETLRSRNARVAKPAGTVTCESPSMMRPSYYYRHETPSYQEWTQRFEQISLQAPTGNVPLSPPPSTNFSSKGSLAVHPHHRGQESFDQPSHMLQTFGGAQEIEPRPLPSPNAFDQQHPAQYANDTNGVSRQLESSSWVQSAPHADEFDFSISPREVRPDWSNNLHGTTDAFYEDMSAAKSTPALARTESDFSSHGLIIGQYGQFITEDPSVDYFATSMDPFQVTEGHIRSPPLHVPPLPQEDSNRRPSTPVSQASSPGPSPPTPPTKSPSKARQRSRTHRRKNSAPALKSSKSAGAMGFVNFTPHDSQKILTGVAPSGSSKTKARREMEAHEKKRRLSLAVEKAVRDAGGDSEKLKLAGLL